MYSSSNSFLGGGDSSRSGLPQYGQQTYGIPQGQQLQRPNGFPSQPASFGQQPMQQFTGYPMPSQPTGFQSPPVQQPQVSGFPGQQQTFSAPPPQQQSGQPH